MGIACCSSRDRNDSVKNLENRHDKFFYNRNPRLIDDVDRILADA